MLKKYGAKNGGTGIVMDVNSGAIVAMASYPNYDLNDYGTIFDDALKTKLDTELAKIDAKRSTYESEEAYAEARSAAINSAVQSQWRNKCIDSTYEPGSTFKPITLAAEGFQILVVGLRSHGQAHADKGRVAGMAHRLDEGLLTVAAVVGAVDGLVPALHTGGAGAVEGGVFRHLALLQRLHCGAGAGRGRQRSVPA